MHVADHHHLPEGYRARPYVGAADHPAMTAVLAAYRDHLGDPELPTIEQMDAAYSHLPDCDPAVDIALIEHDGDVVAYARPNRGGSGDDPFECVLFTPMMPSHLQPDVFDSMMTAQESHTLPWATAANGRARFRAFAGHPGPGLEPTGEAAWLEARGYEAVEWEATLVRPDLDDIPEFALPHGVELRPVEPEQMRQIWEAHWESFRGEWDFQEATPEVIDAEMAEPYIDHTLWKVAWVGDQVVGQVKSFINPVENEERGHRRGYAEYISTHRDWRNRGIAGALLSMSLVELRDRGMTEAVLGVDTNNPGGAFQLYTKLGFELHAYAAIYARDIT